MLRYGLAGISRRYGFGLVSPGGAMRAKKSPAIAGQAREADGAGNGAAGCGSYDFTWMMYSGILVASISVYQLRAPDLVVRLLQSSRRLR